MFTNQGRVIIDCLDKPLLNLPITLTELILIRPS